MIKKNINLIINKKNKNKNYLLKTEHFISDLLDKEHFSVKNVEGNTNIYNNDNDVIDNDVIFFDINYVYTYISSIICKYKLYLIFLIIIFLILKKIIIYFLYTKNV